MANSRVCHDGNLCLFISSLLRRAEILRLAGIRRQARSWPQFARGDGKPLSLVLQSKADEIDRLIQAEVGRVDDDIVQMSLIWLRIEFRLQVAHTVAILQLDTRTGSILVESFAAYYVGNAHIERSDNARVQHIAPPRQQHLRRPANDNDVSPPDGGIDNPTQRPSIRFGVGGKGVWLRTDHQRRINGTH